MSRLAVFLIALATVTVAVPSSVLGQVPGGSSEVTVTTPVKPRPVRPNVETPHSVTVQYEWTGFSNEPTQIQVDVIESPAWLDAYFVNTTFQVNNTTANVEETQPGSPDSQHREVLDMNFTVLSNATAFETGTLRVRATAEENGMIPAAEGEASVEITAGFRGSVDVRLPKGGNVTAWGGTLTKIPVQVENQANGPIQVSVSIVRSPADAVLEPPLSFQVNATEGDRVGQGDVEARVPWTVTEEGQVVLEVTPSHAQTGASLRTVEAAFQLNGKAAAPIPSPAPWLVLAGIGLLALARARGRGPRD